MTTTTTSGNAYVTPWVDGTRASRTHVARRTLGPLARIVAFDALTGPLAARPLGRIEHLLVAPDDRHLVLRGADAAWIFDLSGKHVGSVPRSTSAGLTFATRTGVFHALDEYDFTGTRAALSVFVPLGRAGRVWATHVTADSIFVVNQEAMEGNHGDRTPQQLELVANHLVPGSPAKKLLGGDVMKDAWGLGAITRNSEIVALSTSGELRVYAPEADAQSFLKKLHTAKVGFAPYDVSIIDSTIALLEAEGVPAVDDLHWRGPYQPDLDLFLRFGEMTARWKTKLHLVSLQGTDTAQITVPFEVLQPPVEGGGGRIYLAGTGFAAIQDGKVQWSQAPTARTLVTAFDGGEVALTIGRELRLVDRDGNIRQSFTTPAEAIVTPPAIGGDGSVWFATDKGIYAAR